MKTVSGKRLLAAALIAGATSLASGAQAMTLIGVFGGNDPFPNNISGELPGGTQFNSPALAKCDVPEGALGCGWSDGKAEGDYASAFTVDFTDAKSGTWSFDKDAVTGTGTVLYPAYMAVKAGPQYALYALEDSFSGAWNTYDLFVGQGNNPALSHLSFYDTAAPVPLPAAAWLLLGGLGALGAASRRKQRAA